MNEAHLQSRMPFKNKGTSPQKNLPAIRAPLLLLAGALLPLWITPTNAAGPRLGEVYLGVGTGVFAPKFDVTGKFENALNPPPLGSITVELPGGASTSIQTGAGDASETDVQTENLEMISLDAVIGYQITHQFSAEVAIDLSLITLDVEGLEVTRISAGAPDTLAINVMPPEMLPITFSGVYSFAPQARVSPYLGFGALLALLNTNTHQSRSDLNDLFTLEGGVELGYFAHAGIRVDISKSRYVFADIKYGRVSSPDLDNRLGVDVDVDKFEMRHLKFGLGYPFSF